MKKGDKIKVKIAHQGAPIVNYGEIAEVGKNIIGLYVDLKSKYCEVDAMTTGSDGICGVYIGTNEESIKLKEDVDRNEPTKIEFPEFKGWNVFAAHLGRYTLSVCLIRN